MKLPTAKQITIIIAQIGIRPTLPIALNISQRFNAQRAKNPNVGFSRTTPGIGRPPDRRYAHPLKIVCEANVAMIAGIPIDATIQPLSTPINTAIAIETMTASHMFQPIFIIR